MWLHLPEPTSVSHQGTAGSIEPSETCFQELAVSVTWRSKSRSPRLWSRGWQQATWMRRLFGPTFARSTAERSEAVRTFWSAAIPASRTASPGEDSEPTILGTCGHRYPASWGRCALPWCTSRTLQTTFLEDSSASEKTFKRWATGIRSAWSARAMSARLTSASGCSSSGGWATPRVSAERNSRSSMTRDGHWAAPSLEQMAELSMGMLPREFASEAELTPQAGRVYAAGLRLWATASATVANDGESPETWRARQSIHKDRGINGNGMGVPLAIQAQETMGRLWPTANVPNGGRMMKAQDVERRGMTDRGKRQVDLASAARLWASPRASDTRSGMVSDDVWERNSRPLTEQAIRWMASQSGHHSPTTTQDGAVSSRAGPGSLRLSLNEVFVSWLMLGRSGIGWMCLGHPATATEAISFEGSGTAWSHSKPLLHSDSSGAMSSMSGCEVMP